MKASDRAHAALLEDIQTGALAPGAVLIEAEQATRLGVSRTPMREAIGRLMAEGLVRQQSPRVMIVTPFDAKDVRQLFETRRALEEVSVRLAAQHHDREVFDEIAESFEGAKPIDAASIDAYYAMIARLEQLTDAATDNVYLTAALRTIRTHLTRARKLARANQTRLAASVTEHALIARAIADGDAELAAHATHIHLHNALTSILESIRKGPQ